MAETHTTKGPGLARGPALIIGTILTAFGLILFLKAGDTPTNTFPDGSQNGETFLGFETNGWTAFFTTTAGALLLFGAAQHMLAKVMSLLVGGALVACAVIAFIDSEDVLGLAAANFPTKLGWAIAGGVLLFNVFAPRVKHKDEHETRDRHRETPETRRAETTPTGRFDRERPVDDQRTAEPVGRSTNGSHDLESDRIPGRR